MRADDLHLRDSIPSNGPEKLDLPFSIAVATPSFLIILQVIPLIPPAGVSSSLDKTSMAGGGGGLVVRVWKDWSIQILVVTSFLLQLVLLAGGGIRRRSSSGVLMALLWLSYLMADNIAVYALGHMTLESRPRDAGLVAFWATFFLLHLGGQDTIITAFSMEDNQLWRRHLLTLMVQASGAGYALYRYTIPGTWTLVSATIVMFIVGFIKYGERVWALQRGNTNNFHLGRAEMDREEVILPHAHYMFYFCKGAFANVNRLNRFSDITHRFRQIRLPYRCDLGLYDLVEAELSLLYDLFYTKAQVVHTWQGYLIRAISLLGTVGAFLLFRRDDGKGAYNKVDISITYLLLVGAIILETTSVLRVAGSTWMRNYLHRRGWHRTSAMVVCLRRLLKVGRQRKWLHSIGQHNVLDYRTRKQTKRRNRIVKAMPLQKIAINTAVDDKSLVEAIKVLSNYMKFLMMHPSLLPGGVPHDLTEDDMDGAWNKENCFTGKEFARSLLDDKPSLAHDLLGKNTDVPMLKVIFELWVELLCYAAHHSTDISHCRQLGRGGEFLTVIRLVVDHIELVQSYNKKF
ncbi:hypothetical protein VPH35_094034 [Triticum aestivum]